MKSNLRKDALRMLARANELGLVTKSGTPLAVDQLEELLAAKAGYRNAHAYKAALESREAPALEQELPDESGSDYKLVSGTGVWIRMNQYLVHAFVREDDLSVSVYPGDAGQNEVKDLYVHDWEVEAELLKAAEIDDAVPMEIFRNWVRSEYKKDFDSLTSMLRCAALLSYQKKSDLKSVRFGSADELGKAYLNNTSESVIAQVTVAQEPYFLFVRWTGLDYELVWRDQEGQDIGESFAEYTENSVADLEKAIAN